MDFDDFAVFELSDTGERKRKFINNVSGLPGVEGAVLVTLEGLPIASTLPEGIDEIKVAGMIAALFALAEGSVTEMEKGEFSQLFINSSDGYLLIMQVERNTILAISLTKDVRLGLIFPFLDAKRISEKFHSRLDCSRDCISLRTLSRHKQAQVTSSHQLNH